MRRFATVGGLGVLLCALALHGIRSVEAAPASGVRYWLGGEDPVTLADKHRSEPADFMALFTSSAPWQRAATDVTAFKISMQFASRANAADLAALISDLRRRHIALAIEMGMLRNDKGCGKGEGYMSSDLLTTAMKRIRQAGGRLDYVAMDEVVFFGHEKTWADSPGQVPCRDTLPVIAREVAANVALIHQFFPQTKVGATEPITTDNHVDLSRAVHDDVAFADLYRRATGTDLAFMHADIAWRSKNWFPGVAPLKAAMESRGIRFGIIVGGDPDYDDDIAWTSAGLHQLKMLSSDPATAPDDVVVQSWQPLPKSYLPENQPGTITWMLLQAENENRRSGDS